MLAPDSNIEPDQSLVQQVIAEKGLKDGQYEVYYRVWDKLGGVVPLTQHGFVMRSEHPHITPDFAGRHTVDNIQDPLNRKLFLSLLTSCSQRNHQERYMSATSFFEWALWEAIRRVDTGVHEQVYISTIIVPSTAVDSDNPCLVFEAYPLRDAGSGKHGIPDGKRDPLHFARRAYENKFYAKIPAEYVMSTIVLYRDVGQAVLGRPAFTLLADPQIPPTLPEIRQAISLNPQLANDGPCFHQTCYRARSYGSKDAIPFIHSRARAAGMSPDVVPLNIVCVARSPAPSPLLVAYMYLDPASPHENTRSARAGGRASSTVRACRRTSRQAKSPAIVNGCAPRLSPKGRPVRHPPSVQAGRRVVFHVSRPRSNQFQRALAR